MPATKNKGLATRAAMNIDQTQNKKPAKRQAAKKAEGVLKKGRAAKAKPAEVEEEPLDEAMPDPAEEVEEDVEDAEVRFPPPLPPPLCAYTVLTASVRATGWQRRRLRGRGRRER